MNYCPLVVELCIYSLTQANVQCYFSLHYPEALSVLYNESKELWIVLKQRLLVYLFSPSLNPMGFCLWTDFSFFCLKYQISKMLNKSLECPTFHETNPNLIEITVL